MNRFYKVLYKAKSLLVSHEKERWERAFFKACKTGNLSRIKNLCKPEFKSVADIHAENEWGFEVACRNGYFDIVRFLSTSKSIVDAGHTFVDIHANDDLGFRLACKYGHFEVVKFLTTSKDLVGVGHTFVDIHTKDGQGFKWACVHGNLDIVKFLTTSPELLDAGHALVDINESCEEVFRWACHEEKRAIIQFFIFELKVRKTQKIESTIRDFPEVECYFNAREEAEMWSQIISEEDRKSRGRNNVGIEATKKSKLRV